MSGKTQPKTKIQSKEPQRKVVDRRTAEPGPAPQAEVYQRAGPAAGLPSLPTTRRQRQQAILQLQRTYGNNYARQRLRKDPAGDLKPPAAFDYLQRENGEGEGATAGALSSALFRDDATLLSILRGEDTLERGEEGPAVTKVQRALVAAGYSLGRHGADGDFGGTTEGVVRQFQEDHPPLNQNGTVDAATLRALDRLPSTQRAQVGVRAVHMPARSSGRAYMLDWESRHRNIAQNDTLREAFDENLANQIERVFGEALTLEQVLERIDAAETGGRDDEAMEMRRNLSVANQFAVVSTLAVEESDRYQPVPGGATYCNIYAYDVVTALGGYLPRVWWNNSALRRLRSGEDVPVRYGRTVHEMNANALTRWMQEFGGEFGWRRAENIDKAQESANNGKLVILLAANSNPRRSGHVNVVMPEIGESRAIRGDSGEVTTPMQSQAGRRNFEYRTSGSRWWADANHRDGAAWIFEGRPSSPLIPPEQLGRRSDMRQARLEIGMDVVDDEIFGQEQESFNINRQVNLVPDAGPRMVSIRECVGGEVVVNLELELSLSTGNAINGAITAALYEGTSCSTDDLEDQATEAVQVEDGGRQQVTMELVNRETFGGDRASIDISISSSNE